MAIIAQILASSYPKVLTEARKPFDQWSENAALKLLDKYGFVSKESLGSTIDVVLDHEATSLARIQSSAMEAFTITAESDVIGGATYAVAEVSAAAIWSKLTEAKNSTDAQKVDLAKALIMNALNSHDDKVEEALFASSTNGLLGLLGLVADDGEGTVGGIVSGTDTMWRNQVGTPYESDGSNLETIMTTVWNACMKGTGGKSPNLLLSGSEAHALFEGTQQGNQRWVDTQDWKVAAKALWFKSAPYGFSPYGDDHIYFLQKDSFRQVISKQFNRKEDPPQILDAYNATIMKIYTALQHVVTNRSRLGVCFQET